MSNADFIANKLKEMAQKSNVPNADPQILLSQITDNLAGLETIEATPTPKEKPVKKTTKKPTKYQQAQTRKQQNADFDDDLPKTPPTFYNSYTGSILVNNQMYFHGERGPDGQTVIAPKLTNGDWGSKYEQFDTLVSRFDPVTNEKYEIYEPRPAELNWLDKRLMEYMEKYPRLLILAFREAHKSSNGMRFIKRQIADLHKTVSYFSSTSEKATEFTEKIKTDFLFNRQINEDYGYFLDEKQTKTKEKMYWVFQREQASREPGLSIGSVEGKSRMGGHPDIVILDDPIGENMTSQKSLDNAWSWYTKQIAPMARGHTKIIIIGTIKDKADIYSKLIDSKLFQVFKLPAIEIWPNDNQHDPADTPHETFWYYIDYRDEHMLNPETRGVKNLIGGQAGFDEFRRDMWHTPGRVQYYVDDDPSKGIDKNRMALQEFLLVRKLDPMAFEYEYQLNPIPIEKGFFQWDKIHWFEYDDPGVPIRSELFSNVCAFFDQAFGSGNRADYNAIAVMARVIAGETNRFYLLDVIAWQGGGVDKKIEMVGEIFKKWPFISQMGIEADVINSEDFKMIQASLPHLPIESVYQRQMRRDESGREIPFVNFEIPKDIPLHKHTKIKRIVNNLDTVINLGYFNVHKRITDIELFNNCKSFPYCEKLDIIDAVSSAKFLVDGFSLRDFGWGGSHHGRGN